MVIPGLQWTFNTAAEEYGRLIATHSDHVVLPEESRPGFYGGIRAAIERFGGVITLHETVDLQMAKKEV